MLGLDGQELYLIVLVLFFRASGATECLTMLSDVQLSRVNVPHDFVRSFPDPLLSL